MTYAEGGAGGVGADYGGRGWRSAGVETAELTHEEVRDQLTEFLAGGLDEAQRSRVARHLAECAACAAYLSTFKGTIDLLGNLPTRTAPGRLRQRLLTIPDDQQASVP